MKIICVHLLHGFRNFILQSVAEFIRIEKRNIICRIYHCFHDDQIGTRPRVQVSTVQTLWELVEACDDCAGNSPSTHRPRDPPLFIIRWDVNVNFQEAVFRRLS